MSDRGVSSARAKVHINGKEAGWATGVGVDESINQIPIEVLGEIDAVAIEATGRSVSVTCDFVRIKGKSLMEMGIWPRGGTSEIVEAPPLTIELYDIITDQPIAKVEGCKVGSRPSTRGLSGSDSTMSLTANGRPGPHGHQATAPG